MDYIIFMLTIQAPFLYVIWNLFSRKNSKNKLALRLLKKQNEHIANFMGTLKMSFERISEDLYGNGKINARFFEIEKKVKDFQQKIQDMEVYTGLNNNEIKEFSPSPVLKDKDFI